MRRIFSGSLLHRASIMLSSVHIVIISIAPHLYIRPGDYILDEHYLQDGFVGVNLIWVWSHSLYSSPY